MKKLLIAILFIPIVSFAQLVIRSINKLDVPPVEQWGESRFSPDGQYLYLTTAEYRGIWQFDRKTGILREITGERQAGFEFSISSDGSKLAFRSQTNELTGRERIQRAVQYDLKSGSSLVFYSGNDIPIPVFVNDNFINPAKPFIGLRSPQTFQTGTVVLGVNDAKIQIMSNGTLTQLDPISGGRYIWPRLRPQGGKIVAAEMQQGVFVSNIDGSDVRLLGKFSAPQWDRTGKYIVGMADRDDGYQIISSDIIATSADGNWKINLTDQFEKAALFPVCSTIEDIIIFSTLDGEVYELQYEEVQ